MTAGVTMDRKRVFRFAPSPNGYLHLGHAYSALLDFDLARQCGGRFLLRIEDIDTGRARTGFEAAIHEDLAWLGLEWEAPVRRQSEHFDDYARALERLDDMGLLYACDCRRSDIARAAAAKPNWPHDPDGAPLYPGTCRDKPRRAAREVLMQGGVALRLDMRKAAALAGQGLSWREFGLGGVAADPAAWGDVVLARKDTPASYHIAVVVDDALQGVTDVVRGKDLFAATSLHRLLQCLLELPAPDYRHHDLVLDETGEKLSKSLASIALRALRAQGWTPADVRRRIGL
ncbi:MAG: tRNA glutamyl-Q(34) synthetase GluQRS [Alphaproteobacteria bacterium]|nr:tRNA glutamyl-Q(34) synthetase GluQRS [Alphaproteobacteria bacterium]MBM3653024.1 tRNA glutamyl-Q(34) synthetase GluQRS [Alphaproteobacteria bacterium]